MTPTCHPDRPHQGYGLCRTCWAKAKRHGELPNSKPATCHPERAYYAGDGLCYRCYSREYARRRRAKHVAQGLTAMGKPRNPRHTENDVCGHLDLPHYSLGRCQRCYTTAHNLRQYGITLEDYLALEQAQGGVCAICGKGPRDWGAEHRNGRPYKRKADQRLAVDHDHETDKVRGLLCNPCNRALGLFGDDPALLRAALAYIGEDI